MIRLLVLVSFCFTTALASAQQLTVTTNGNFFDEGDTLQLDINYIPADSSAMLYTLLMVAENNTGAVWELRWPLLSNKMETAVAVPPKMPHGNYTLTFLLLKNIFTIEGKVLEPKKVKKLNSTLLTAAGDVYKKEITVLPDSTFIYTNVLFEENAILSFITDAQSNTQLNISINNASDAIVPGVLPVAKNIFIGTKAELAVAPTPKKALNNVPYSKDIYTLEVVTVQTTKKTKAERYNDKFSSGIFRSADERIIDLTDEVPAFNNVLQYLTGRVAGLRILNNGFSTAAIWRNSRVFFYLDEMRVDAQVLNGIPISDIAIVKAYPPPFFGNPGGNGGGIAVYTKRGQDDYAFGKSTFKVKGYTPLFSTFSVTPTKY